jgi:hypothetical protein
MARWWVVASVVCGVALTGGCASNRDGAMERCRQLSRVEGVPEGSAPTSRQACLDYLDGRDNDRSP